MTLTLLTPPVDMAVSIADLKDHSRLIDDTAEDPLLGSLIEAATAKVEAVTGLALINRTYTFKVDGFGSAVRLPVAPVVSVSSLTYVDTLADTQTLSASAYALVDRLEYPRIIPAYGETFPATLDFPESVTVTFVAGFSDDANDIPDDLKQAVLKTAAGLYEYREDITTANASELPNGVQSLLASHVRWKL